MAGQRPTADTDLHRVDTHHTYHSLLLHRPLSVLPAFPLLNRQPLEKVLPDDAQQSIDDLTQLTEGRRQTVLENINVFGDIIATRWTSWPPEKRYEVLQTARMRTSRSPVHATSPIVDRQLQSLKSTHEDPDWLHDEAFHQDPSVFLGLIEARAQQPPHKWAAFDCRQLKDDLSPDAPPLLWSKAYHHLHGERYGQSAPEDYMLACTWTTASFRWTFATAYDQYNIVQTLRFATQIIVADAKPSGCKQWKLLAARGFRDQQVPVLAGSYFGQCISSPPVFDLAGFAASVDGQIQRLLDEVKMMQTDPVYMQHYVKDLKAAASFGEVEVPVAQQSLIIARMFLSDTSENLVLWRHLQLAISKAMRLAEQRGVSVKPGQPLPSEVHAAIVQLTHVAEACRSMQWDRVAQQMPFVRAFRPYFSYSVEQQMPVLSPPVYNAAKQQTETPPDWRLTFIDALYSEETGQDTIALERAFRRFESAMMTKQHGGHIDRRLCNLLDDIAIMDQLATSARYCQIGPPINDRSSAMRSTSPACRKTARATPIQLVSDGSTKRVGLHLDALARTAWPTGIQDAAWYEKTIAPRQQLRALWDEVRSDLDRLTANLTRQSQIVEFDINFDTQQSHVEAVERQRALCYAIPTPRSEAFNTTPRPPTAKAIGNKASNGLRSVRPTKLQPIVQPPIRSKPNVTPQNQTQKSSSTVTGRIPIHKGSYAVLQGIFRALDYEGKKTLEWSAFVKMMYDAGCEVKSQHGSAWSFAYGESKISFHMPHPESYYEHHQVRNIAYRLRWNFGWTMESFVVE